MHIFLGISAIVNSFENGYNEVHDTNYWSLLISLLLYKFWWGMCNSAFLGNWFATNSSDPKYAHFVAARFLF
jgi:hypothetical protein